MGENRNHILIVSDSPTDTNLLRQALTGTWRLSLARNADGARAAAVDLQPDLILLTARRPASDGISLCAWLKQQPLISDIPVILLSEGLQPADEATAFAAGCADCLGMPFHAGVLAARLARLLARNAHAGRLERQVAERTAELGRTREAVVASLASLANCRDQDAGRHTWRTQAYIRCLADTGRGMGMALTDATVEWVALTARLHDIGKVGIPEAILMKPASLTPEETAIVHRHPLIGSAVIRQAERLTGPDTFLCVAREIAECHHEHWDGTGYPHGLRGEEIPIGARLMALADVYDALANSRPYKSALPHEQVVDIIRNGDGRTSPSHFAPEILAAFLRCHETFRAINRRHAPECFTN